MKYVAFIVAMLFTYSAIAADNLLSKDDLIKLETLLSFACKNVQTVDLSCSRTAIDLYDKIKDAKK